MSVCRKSGEPFYTAACSGPASIKFDNWPITRGFQAYLALDKAGATYKGDVIIEKGRPAQILPDGSFSYIYAGRQTRFLLGNSGQIIRFMECYVALKSCTISTQTDQGVLRFPANADDTGAVDFWRDDEARWLAMFDGWKCAEATCGGRFN